MKKVLLSMTLAIVSIGTMAQKQVILKAGTIVPVKSVREVKAADVQEGQNVDFQVTQDINVDGTCVIPGGTMVKGKVMEAKKSSLAGTKGRLVISLNSMNTPAGDPVFFTGSDVRIYGKNRTPLAVVTGLIVWPCIFIPGTKAVMPAGYEVQATVASNTPINVK